MPKDGDDFKRVLQALTPSAAGQWGFGYQADGGADNTVGPFGVAVFAAQLFGGPNIGAWTSGGKLLRDWETDEYKAATSYVRDLMSTGVFPPDVTHDRAVSAAACGWQIRGGIDGYGNSMADLWRRGQPDRHFQMLPFFSPRAASSEPMLSKGYISLNALRRTWHGQAVVSVWCPRHGTLNAKVKRVTGSLVKTVTGNFF